MWWRKPLLALWMPLALTACGFHPLYSKSGSDPGMREEFASITVDPLKDRQGQEIHNALIKTLTPEGPPAEPHYHLFVTYQVTESQAALSTDETATRDVMRFLILYKLYEGNTVLTSGTFPEVFSYNFLSEQFSNVGAQEDIRARVSDQIAIEVHNRLAIYFTDAAQHKAKAAADAAAAAAEKAKAATTAPAADTPK